MKKNVKGQTPSGHLLLGIILMVIILLVLIVWQVKANNQSGSAWDNLLEALQLW